MSGLKAGKYIIELAGNSAPPPSPVGADFRDPPFARVIAGGKNNIWLVRKNDNGTYTLTLKADGRSWLSHPGRDDVIVGPMPGPGEWDIRKQKDDTYSIEEPSPIIPTKKWTLRDTTPGTKVELHFSGFPKRGQLWKFIPFLDE